MKLYLDQRSRRCLWLYVEAVPQSTVGIHLGSRILAVAGDMDTVAGAVVVTEDFRRRCFSNSALLPRHYD